MSLTDCEQSSREGMNVAEFVPLLNFEDDYEILNQFPYTIRRKRDHYEVSEGLFNNGYIRVCLNRKNYLKHVLIANQFLINYDPINKTQVDHISHDRTDYHLSNLRWVSPSENNRNKSSFKGTNYQYVDDIADESIVVDFYDTRNGRREFKDYYYHDGVFYYDNDINYRILNINKTKCGARFVNMIDINGKKTAVYVNRFLQQHDLL